jgi:hypothetical protein
MIVNPALYGNVPLDTAPRIRFTRGGGFMVEPNYTFVPNFNSDGVSKYGCDTFDGFGGSMAELDTLLAWAVCATSNSNTITIVNNRMLIGNGVGQQDRVGAAELAIKRAIDAGHKDELHGAVACSDSFFPYPDAVEVLIRAGIGTIFSTSGSVNDKAVQDLCVSKGVVLVQLPDSRARGFFGH